MAQPSAGRTAGAEPVLTGSEPARGGGRAFTERQASEIRAALRRARQGTGLYFSVHVGRAEGGSRAYATRLHAELGAVAPSAVLIFVDPEAHKLEIVTGEQARRRLDDRTCALAAMSMSTSFSVGDLAGGIISGISMLADHARQSPVIHRHSWD